MEMYTLSTLGCILIVSGMQRVKFSVTQGPQILISACGISITHQTPLIINGILANLTDFPWHATLYGEEITNAGVQKKFRCGATIIRTNLVMTAAHCIYDEKFRLTVAPNKLWIMTGNLFRDFDSPLHNPLIVKNSTVKNVYRHCQYHGLIGNYASDIALLELERPFTLSDILLPACLDTEGYSAQILEVGAVGRVAGFGRTATGTSSSILQTIKVPYVSYSDCQQSPNAQMNLGFISNEKFCGGYNNGSAVCDGDSGGGLVFKKSGQWYVMGIVSLGLGTSFNDGDMTCDAFSYTLYTKVPNYMSWIQKIIFDLETYQTSKESECR